MRAMTAESKRALRRELRAQRRALGRSRDVHEDDVALAAVVMAAVTDAGLRRGASVTLYESIPDEPPTAGAIAALHDAGLHVLVPLTLADLDLDWTLAQDPERRPLGLHGIARAELILAPGLSVDSSGTRLGQGGGCYDRALPRRAPGTSVLVLLHPEEFPGPALPRDAHDVSVDGVLTAGGILRLPTPR